MAIPPRLMVLMERCIRWSTTIEVIIANGMVTSEITVVRRLPRKSIRMRTTKIPPSRMERSTLPIELSMKRLWRKMSVWILTSLGRFFCRSFSAVSRRSVNSKVPTPGCLVTVSSTACWPQTLAVPILGVLPPIFTSPIWSRVTGKSSLLAPALTTAAPISSRRVVESMPRRMYSLPYS